jgi:hypothetical protein
MKRFISLSIVLLILGLFLVGCEEETTEPDKVATLEFLESSIEVLDAENFQYQITFSLENTGNATATNIEGKIGVKFEGETETIWMDEWIPLDQDITAGSTYTETYVDNEDNEEDFNDMMASEIFLQFQWETE